MKTCFDPVIYPDSKILILGTMPGEKSLELQEYYGNRGNQFWRLLFTLFNEGMTQDYNLKLDLLQRHRIAVWDVLEGCEREGSLDSNIKREVPNDLIGFYERYPNISHVFFSSKNAAAYYDRYIGRTQGIAYETLPSPSGANATRSFAEKLAEWKQKILSALVE